MAKGKKKKEKTGYFYEAEEMAVVDYLNEENEIAKNKIFQTKLLPAFTKMIESIIRRYKLYLPDEEFIETFDDTISFLMTKINLFKPESGYKAYSYCGTVCKNYLIWRISQFNKHQMRNTSYDDIQIELTNNSKYSYDQHSSKITYLTKLIESMSEEVDVILQNKDSLKLNANEIKIGNALKMLLDNWEDLFARMGSNKFNKSSILLFLQESTLLNTNEIRTAMKKYKAIYSKVKEKMIEEYL